MADETLSRRQRILLELLQLAESIRTESGFATDAGLKVFVDESPDLGPDDPDEAIAIMSREDLVTWQAEKVVVRWPIEIFGLAKVTNPQEQWRAALTAEAIAADIKRAFELDDRTLGGLLVHRGIERGGTRKFGRDPGGTTVGAAVAYTLQFTEAWGNP